MFIIMRDWPHVSVEIVGPCYTIKSVTISSAPRFPIFRECQFSYFEEVVDEFLVVEGWRIGGGGMCGGR
jgi:hypothetical protein